MATRAVTAVNNDVYFTLGERWYDADDDPVALLRAESRLHAPWIDGRLRTLTSAGAARVLDVGCGAGFLANALAGAGHDVTGIDVAGPPLDVAARHDATGRARFVRADARAMPFADASFDAVCAMDFLEHVEPIDPFVAEIARVLRPGGLFFFHTFDRTFLSWLVVIRGVSWFVRNAPKDLHVHRLFVKPAELAASCEASGLAMRDVRGCEPVIGSAFFRMLTTGVVPRDLSFRFTRRVHTGYSGFAEKVQAAGARTGVPANQGLVGGMHVERREVTP